MGSKVLRCKFCEKTLKDEDTYASHIEKHHPEEVYPDMVPRQFVYFLRTGKKEGQCVMCKRTTKWNPVTNKYHRFCDDPKCKEKYKELFNNRMIGKYGKTSLLDDPEQQKKMLAARKISGIYLWNDGIHKFPYTGSYEKSFLEFLELFDFPPEDIMAPSPHTYWYHYDNGKHFYIPDFFIPSLNLEIEVKDGGDNPNMHHKIQDVDKVKEQLKDEIISSKDVPFDYLKIVNKNNKAFFFYLEIRKKYDLNGYSKKIVMEGDTIVNK